MDEKMRAEFEAWANSFSADAPTKYKRDALPKDDPNYGDYVYRSLQLAWEAWQASRAALVVRLPEQYRITDGFMDEAVDVMYPLDVIEAIEAAGVRVKQ